MIFETHQKSSLSVMLLLLLLAAGPRCVSSCPFMDGVRSQGAEQGAACPHSQDDPKTSPNRAPSRDNARLECCDAPTLPSTRMELVLASGDIGTIHDLPVAAVPALQPLPHGSPAGLAPPGHSVPLYTTLSHLLI